MAVQPKPAPKKIYKTALTALLLAEAIALSSAESLLPAFSFFPPGAKPGFSNIITMFAAAAVGLPEALLIAVLKSVFVLITRGMTAFSMSIAGGIFSVLVTALFLHQKYGLIITGIAGAITHNIAQLFVCAALLNSKAVFSYAVPLVIFAIAAGSVTGLILKLMLPFLDKQKNLFLKAGKRK